jgi:hypothetical protein
MIWRTLQGPGADDNSETEKLMELLQHYPDHFVVGINDLETGIDQFEALTGVRAVAGGVHPHIGTCNALLSIGEQSYLEIIAPDPGADTARLHPQLKALFTDPLADMATLTPYLWAVGSRDLDDTVSKLAAREIYLTEPAVGARQKPTGRPWSGEHPLSNAPCSRPHLFSSSGSIPPSRHPLIRLQAADSKIFQSPGQT